ncbi:DUF1054 family protein [Aerococcaceae bacterium DSM 111020]|nr:DUF1054 family protein [Aerococcaceae bacterium DSM 111020]
MSEMIFTSKAFEVFDIPSLEEQMPIVRREIQPPFRFYGRFLAKHIQEAYRMELPIYVAKHIQRKVKPLRHTWVAIGGDNRGYKKYPHFEIGINRNFLYIMLCFQFHLLEKDAMARFLMKQDLSTLPEDMKIMTAHFGPEYFSLDAKNIKKGLLRLEQVKGADFQLGRVIDQHNPMLLDSELLNEYFVKTIDDLWSLYLQSMQEFSRLTKTD